MEGGGVGGGARWGDGGGVRWPRVLGITTGNRRAIAPGCTKAGVFQARAVGSSFSGPEKERNLFFFCPPLLLFLLFPPSELFFLCLFDSFLDDLMKFPPNHRVTKQRAGPHAISPPLLWCPSRGPWKGPQSLKGPVLFSVRLSLFLARLQLVSWKTTLDTKGSGLQTHCRCMTGSNDLVLNLMLLTCPVLLRLNSLMLVVVCPILLKLNTPVPVVMKSPIPVRLVQTKWSLYKQFIQTFSPFWLSCWILSCCDVLRLLVIVILTGRLKTDKNNRWPLLGYYYNLDTVHITLNEFKT